MELLVKSSVTQLKSTEDELEAVAVDSSCCCTRLHEVIRVREKLTSIETYRFILKKIFVIVFVGMLIVKFFQKA